jgi:hypothetical protein
MASAVKARYVVKAARMASGSEMSRRSGGRARVNGRESKDGIVAMSLSIEMTRDEGMRVYPKQQLYLSSYVLGKRAKDDDAPPRFLVRRRRSM